MQNNKKKILLTGLGIGALGALGFLGYRHFMAKKQEEDSSGSDYLPSYPSSPSPSYDPPAPRSSGSSTKKSSDGFPLKQGSRGENVKRLQEALIAQVGNFFGGADGIFGKATTEALKKAGYPESVSESTFNVIVGSGSPSGSADAESSAKALYQAAVSRNLTKVLSELKKLKSVADYSSVSEAFKNYRIGAVRMTLVNGLLTVFSKESDKQQIRIQFTRIGLKYDGKTFSLSGIDSAKLITIKPSVVWKDSSQPIQVPAKMVLGTFISERDGYTLFQSFTNQQFLIQSSAVKTIV